jgi:ABC-2 type transport system permease protein
VSTLASEMTAGRLDLPLAYGVSRRRWALAGVATNVAGMTLAVSVMAFTMWVGVRASGTPMLLSTTFAAVANATTVVPLVMGLATLAVVWRPRFAYVIMAALLALFYLVAMFGTALHWPQAVVDVSPFHYLHAAPLEHSNWPATWWFLLAGVLLSSVGLWWFERRDLGA